jgi:hypothetical protein
VGGDPDARRPVAKVKKQVRDNTRRAGSVLLK